MEYNKKKNNALSTQKSTVYSVHITLSSSAIRDADSLSVLRFLNETRQTLLQEHAASHWLTHPIHTPLGENQLPEHTYFYLEPIKKLNQLFAEKGRLAQQIEYLDLFGVTDAIDRHPLLRDAANYHKFCCELSSKANIQNARLRASSDTTTMSPIRKIHAVHPSFLYDEEIKSGLHVSYQKSAPDAQVLYVCSPETLRLALQYCEPNSTLIVDGHWEHEKKSTHGVWEASSAREIAENLSILLYTNPGKINDIRLWGCEAGYLSAFDALPSTFSLDFLQFKYDSFPEKTTQEMAEFRNRACYYSRHGEFPFAENSLAGQILTTLDDPSITITATSSRTYPFPPNATAQYNIASDSDEWSGPHFWSEPRDVAAPEKYKQLHRVKSITVTPQQMSLTTNPISMWYKKSTVVVDGPVTTNQLRPGDLFGDFDDSDFNHHGHFLIS